ncbi:transcription factor FER-LIKE IRON DEFICIENCY-INDUCED TRANSCRIPTION FACTOR-like [Tripterygium wilfordii]|uniref:Transcription factor FER-LIKE IRON DEFICIENCY-INDUCED TRANSCRIPTION FACTOR-like n=1 Tax=Tripterygium wilfordii TaxID=458696 RepID=A0A7J7DEL2_TRIWF|nr:transcription factor FER-LIKE IRON DEFICIENCY-INDUCED TRANSCRIPTION FACTOR-like [Tripterygium wilfordii]KAF5744762.1 transcription factor FER-LIKE IRON DEFICIENCY-INDUCED TRANSCRIPTION FACTOR-like [Tripterygium wilfordii]
MDNLDASANPLVYINDIEPQDFLTDDANFDQLIIDLIRGENEDQFISGYDCDLINGLVVENNNPFGPTQEDVFDHNANSTPMVFNPNGIALINNALMPSLDGNANGELEDNEEEDSSATTTATDSRNRKPDRSRTLISERRRRGRMKEKLYQLRSLVPNITKMDKASIVGDAALYVQELQMQAKKLKCEIAGLEASLAGLGKHQETINEKPKKIRIPQNSNQVCKKIMQMDVFQVEERGFYMKLVCNKGEGVALSLYRALESLTSFVVRSSSLVSVSESFMLTFTLNARECRHDMNLPNTKLWVMGALLNQGFEFATSLCD